VINPNIYRTFSFVNFKIFVGWWSHSSSFSKFYTSHIVSLHILHFLMLKECSSGVGASKFSEVKGRRLTLSNTWVYIKVKSSSNVRQQHFKCHEICYYIHSCLLCTVERFPSISLKLRAPTPFEHFSNIMKMSKVGQNSLPNHEFCETLRITLLKLKKL
jgi:hypothetical protein